MLYKELLLGKLSLGLAVMTGVVACKPYDA